MVALAHGTNDAQKTMGVITLTLITAGLLAPGSGPPFWVILSAGLAIALGTYMGGWRIIRTLGKRVSDIQTRPGLRRRDDQRRGHPHLLPPRASRCPPRRCAPARSSEPAPVAGWPRCTGAWPGGSRWPGASPCPRRRSWARRRRGWPRPAPSGSSSSRSPGWPWPPGSTPRRVAPWSTRVNVNDVPPADHRRHRRLTRRGLIRAHRLGNPGRGRGRRRRRRPHRRPARRVRARRLDASARTQHVDRPSGSGTGTRTTVGRVVAGLCLLAAGLIVCYGLYLIIA